MAKVFIDGSAGTTGLQIAERLKDREDLTLLKLPEELRKSAEARKEIMNSADIVFLCLPDDAAIEAVSLVENPNTTIIDASTAHRTAEGWTYGFAELKGQREKIAASTRIANPGCHASGFIALVAPLVQGGFLDESAALTCFSLTGYSGGGKKMIAEYEAGGNPLLDGPRQYGLTQQHKHLKEMKKISNLAQDPIFCPIVSNFYRGMEVTVPVFAKDVRGNINEIKDYFRTYYSGQFVKLNEEGSEGGFLSASAFAGRDDMQITVEGNEERILLISRFDNLGKGASGAAIQNMNIRLGIEETTGLKVD
ncbi:MAG: N-acetyl-gamma-glutamyl-phosphate reductase [Oscillospiraceae bacterium]|nr:N-acetyl-gamma-glutamyl-phosphate reductase [Oscillospiraceae bacterium]